MHFEIKWIVFFLLLVFSCISYLIYLLYQITLPADNDTTPSTSSTASTTISTVTTSESIPTSASSTTKMTIITTTVAVTGSTSPPDNHEWDLPVSCCKSKPGATGQSYCNLNNSDTAVYYTTGCVKGFGNYVKGHAVTLGGVGIAIACIQVPINFIIFPLPHLNTSYFS